MKRWPIIRHVRFWWHAWRMQKHYAAYHSMGIGLGIPAKSDIEHLEAIWRGEA